MSHILKKRRLLSPKSNIFFSFGQTCVTTHDFPAYFFVLKVIFHNFAIQTLQEMASMEVAVEIEPLI